MLNSPVLVLNKFFFPVDTTSVKRAFLMLYLGAAKAVDMNYETFDFESWSEISSLKKSETIRTVSKTIKIPRVIIVLRYDKVHSKEVKFNRYNIFKRDKSVCQYCKNSFPKNELSIDHVVPKSLGGKTTWENVVCCCLTCNRRKGSNFLSETAMSLSTKPIKPSWELLSNIYLRTVKFEEWKPFLSSIDTSYWNVELEE
jgi:5-methylcytosine-specific restriction endonuclease McrA